MSKISKFIRQVINELKKVVWPSRSETVKWAVQVSIIAVIAGAVIFALDGVGTWIVKNILEIL